MATKLELIQQNRASGMSYLDAARAATSSLSSSSSTPSSSAPTLTPGAGALQIAQAQTTAQNNQVADNNAKNDYAQSVQDAISFNKKQAESGVAGVVQFDANGTALKDTQVSTSTPGVLTSYVAPTEKQTIAPTVNTNTTNQGNTNTQGNTSTITGGSFGAGSNGKQTTQQVVEGQTNRVLGDAVNNYDTNNTIDRTQFEQQKLAAEAKAMETDTELKRFQMEKEQLAAQEDANQKLAAAQEAANMKALQEKERAANEASVAAAQAKADAAERELQIANDIELQKSNVAFAKMGLTLSTAAVTSAQQIYTTGIYNLSKLKSENAFQLADLQVAVAKVEFDHTKVINDIINKSSDKSYEIRKKLNDDIHTIKNSIIDNRFERQKNIDKAIDTYQEAIKANEDEVLNKMNKANAVLQGNVDAFYSSLKVSEGFNQNKIDKYVESGMWGKLSPSERIKLERQAGIAPGTTDSSLRGMVVQNLMKELSDIPGLTSGELTQVSEEAMRLINTGVQRDLAINMALRQNTKYLQSLVKKTKGGGGGSSTTTLNKYTKQIITDPETGIAQIAYFDKTTGVFSHIENMTKDVVVNKTSLDAKSGLAAAGQSLLNGGGIVGAIVAGVSQANKGKTTTPTVQKVPVKMKDITTSDWLVNLNK